MAPSAAGTGASIVNGSAATNADVSGSAFDNPVGSVYVVLDQTKKNGMAALCTGTLISPTIVLTAAHCVESITQNSRIIVSFQITTLDGKTITKENSRAGIDYIIHPGYVKATQTNTVDQFDDIALIKLSGPAPVGVTPANLAPASLNFASINSFTTTGFGMTDDRKNAPENDANTLNYMTIDSQDIQISTDAGPLSGMYVADGTKKSVCHGDSGGPLFSGSPSDATHTIVGINDMVFPIYSGQQETDWEAAESSGNSDSFYQKYPDAHICLGVNVYVPVAPHIDWIKQSAQTLAQAPARQQLPAAPVAPAAQSVTSNQ